MHCECLVAHWLNCDEMSQLSLKCVIFVIMSMFDSSVSGLCSNEPTEFRRVDIKSMCTFDTSFVGL